ncbi:hypothetical protein T03_7031 [Trichinella britovi]|uniref:Uncharacterized protein n=1 Tax=Trichinella britovi TaxID=45882 RepID=A0A0V0YQX8_TRIBR|nr:hypothetical protein T03_7031 [Trichinella britovi]
MTNYKWGPVAERQTPRRRCERLRGTKSRPEEDVHFCGNQRGHFPQLFPKEPIDVFAIRVQEAGE